MRMTLLELVTDILNDLDADPVDSYTDTTESQQVAQILKTTYFNIVDGRDWPHLFDLFQLTETSTSTPTTLTIPNTINKIQWIKYDNARVTDTRTKYTEIFYKSPKDFMEMLNGRVSSATNVDIKTDASGLSLLLYNDRPPSYYTSFTDDAIVMDAYDSAVETFIKTTKNQCYGKKYPSVTLSDGVYFDLPTEMFSYLLAEAKSTAFIVLKQAPNPKADQISVIQRRRMSWESWNINKKNKYPDFGRRSAK